MESGVALSAVRRTTALQKPSVRAQDLRSTRGCDDLRLHASQTSLRGSGGCAAARPRSRPRSAIRTVPRTRTIHINRRLPMCAASRVYASPKTSLRGSGGCAAALESGLPAPRGVTTGPRRRGAGSPLSGPPSAAVRHRQKVVDVAPKASSVHMTCATRPERPVLELSVGEDLDQPM